jgi:DNA polymerase III sliding clamp (beta) subunit (PCNA family)
MKQSHITPIVTVPGREFAEAFRIVATGADQKGTRLIDTHVLVVTDADAGTVVLRTARTGYSFKYIIRNQAVQTSDMFTLGVNDMNKRLMVLKDAVTLTRTAPRIIQFNVGSMSFALQSLDPDDFASDRSLQMTPLFTFSSGELARYLRLVMATVDSRYYLPIGGVWIRSSEDGKRLILASAREGHGGTRCEVPVNLVSNQPMDVIVPKPMVQAILVGLSVADKDECQVEIMREPTGNLLGVRIGCTTVSGQFTNDTFPPIDSMLTRGIETSCQVPRDALAAPLNMIYLSWDRKDIPSRVVLRFGRDEFQVFNPIWPQNQATFQVPVMGEPMQIQVNTKQVQAIVADLKAPVVQFGVTDGTHKHVFITDPADPKYLHVAFPFDGTFQRDVSAEEEVEEEDEEYQEAA